jgi:hypothetical protein
MVLAVSFLGFVRSVYKPAADTKVDFESKESYFNWKGFEYGLIGIEAVFERGAHNIHFGKTYLSVFSNFVPRKIWPDKPDTGGAIFTAEYMDDQWGGSSVATPGILGEGMINFGATAGILFGYFAIISLNFGVIRVYARVKYSNKYNFSRMMTGIHVLIYIIILKYVNGLMVGEFTMTTMYFTMSLIVIIMLKSILIKGFYHDGIRS